MPVPVSFTDVFISPYINFKCLSLCHSPSRTRSPKQLLFSSTVLILVFLFRISSSFNLRSSAAVVEIGPAVHGWSFDTLIMDLNQHNYMIGGKKKKTY